VLVQQASIDDAISEQFIGRHEPKSTESVLNADANEVVAIFVDNWSKILATITKSVTTTMDPDKDWQVRCVLWSLDVQEEAVFASR